MPDPNSNDTRARIEKLREKAAVAYDGLSTALDEAGHGDDCVLRCIENPDCDVTHYCDQCLVDGER